MRIKVAGHSETSCAILISDSFTDLSRFRFLDTWHKETHFFLDYVKMFTILCTPNFYTGFEIRRVSLSDNIQIFWVLRILGAFFAN